jgi:hypothetical protein
MYQLHGVKFVAQSNVCGFVHTMCGTRCVLGDGKQGGAEEFELHGQRYRASRIFVLTVNSANVF